MVTLIDDPDDPRIAAYRDVRERDLVGREGLFVAEGWVVVRRLFSPQSLHRPLSLLVARKRLASLSAMIETQDGSVEVFAAEPPVLDAITGFHLHRGILALGRRADPVPPDQLLAGLPERAVVMGLFGVSNHDNIGGLLRNAAAFGVGAVILDAGCCDPLYRKAIRVSVGAALTTPLARLEKGEDALELFARHGFTALALSPSGAASLAELTPPARAAALFGAEGPGLPPELMARAVTVRIPMAGGFDSLNVATASGIVLHHLATGAR